MRITSSDDSGRDKKVLSAFLGLNNKLDPMRGRPATQGVGAKTWQLLQQADNVNLSDSGSAARRDGYENFVAATNITGSFTTFDFRRMFIVDNGTLKQVNQDGTTVDLADGLSGTCYWTEVNDSVYLSCSEKVEIKNDGGVRAWGVPVPQSGSLVEVDGRLDPGVYQVCFTHTDEDGREGGATPSLAISITLGGIQVDVPTLGGYYTNIYLATKGTPFYKAGTVPYTTTRFVCNSLPQGRELTNAFLDEPPAQAGHVAYFKGRLYAAQYVPESDATVIWYSEALGFHLFNLNDSFFMVPGKVVQMAGSDSALMLSTDRRTFLYNQDGLDAVAEYGAIDGQHADIGPDGKLYWWSSRGLCRAAPFENLTESNVSVDPGVRAAGGVIQQHGYTRYVTVLKRGGAAFNKR